MATTVRKQWITRRDTVLSPIQEGFVVVASNRIRCTVVAVEVSSNRIPSGAFAKDLLPWADPYVAQLIRNLQDEVRRERRTKSLAHYCESTFSAGDVTTRRRISAAK